mmetsp:Transcript_46/g.175  ORF Transcript_46/g.175 Transcript_46/m.175 type:complete len:644 (-) Transcript_46:54-1985(-)
MAQTLPQAIREALPCTPSQFSRIKADNFYRGRGGASESAAPLPAAAPASPLGTLSVGEVKVLAALLKAAKVQEAENDGGKSLLFITAGSRRGPTWASAILQRWPAARVAIWGSRTNASVAQVVRLMASSHNRSKTIVLQSDVGDGNFSSAHVRRLVKTASEQSLKALDLGGPAQDAASPVPGGIWGSLFGGTPASAGGATEAAKEDSTSTEAAKDSMTQAAMADWLLDASSDPDGVRLDDFVGLGLSGKVVFLQFENNGCEARALQGAKRLLQRQTAAVVLFEYSKRWRDCPSRARRRLGEGSKMKPSASTLKSTVLELERFGYVALAAHAVGGAFRPLNFGFWDDFYEGDDFYEAENGDAVTIVAVSTQAKFAAPLIKSFVSGACFKTTRALLPLPCSSSDYGAVPERHYVAATAWSKGDDRVLDLLRSAYTANASESLFVADGDPAENAAHVEFAKRWVTAKKNTLRCDMLKPAPPAVADAAETDSTANATAAAVSATTLSAAAAVSAAATLSVDFALEMQQQTAPFLLADFRCHDEAILLAGTAAALGRTAVLRFEYSAASKQPLKAIVELLQARGFFVLAVHRDGNAFRPLSHGFWRPSYELQNGTQADGRIVCVAVNMQAFRADVHHELVHDLASGAC